MPGFLCTHREYASMCRSGDGESGVKSRESKQVLAGWRGGREACTSPTWMGRMDAVESRTSASYSYNLLSTQSPRPLYSSNDQPLRPLHFELRFGCAA